MGTVMRHESVHELFSRTAERFASNIAIDYEGRSVTYSELEERSNRLANFLRASGASAGSMVAIVLEDTIEVITAVLATLKAGCVFVPLDASMPLGRLEAILAEVKPEWFIVEAEPFSKIHKIIPTNGREPKVICADRMERYECPSDTVVWLNEYGSYDESHYPSVSSHPDDMCYVFFTSGSTGRPKGIAGRLKAIDHFVRWEINSFGVGEGTRVSQLTSPSFDAFLRDMFVPLCAGGIVCATRGRHVAFDSEKLVDWLDIEQINLVHCVPSLFRAILQEHPDPHYFPALKYILLAGEPLHPSDVRKWTEIYGGRVQLVNLYGPSETTMTKFVYLVRLSDKDRRSIPIGRPMAGAAALLVDEAGRPCPVGAVGEIYIRTPYRSLGYYQQPELTNEVFIRNPFNNDPEDLVYKTGDLGRVLEDGDFEILGRKDHQVKVRGVRIELGEIEDLLRADESVTEAVVVGRDDSQGNKYLCAYVELRDQADASELRSHLSARLPASMVPSAFVVMDALPRTISGKVDRRALPDPNSSGGHCEQRFVAPGTPAEEALAAIWSQVLRLERIGIHDNFFTLGGHSLLATQVISRVRQTFHLELAVRSLFESPTVCGLAQVIEASQKSGPMVEAPPLVQVPRDQELPLSFAQQRLWFLDQLEPGRSTYNIPAAFRACGKLNLPALEQTLSEIVRRHEALRTRFESVEGRPVQVIEAERPVKLEVADLRKLPVEAREGEARRLVREEARRPFDLARGPLMRATVVRLEEEEHVLLFTVHHIVSDGWSVGVLIREVLVLYEAYNKGEESPLPELQIQYPDYAFWQREWLQGRVLEEELRYWKEKLAGVPGVIELPCDRPRPLARSDQAAAETFVLPEGVCGGLRELSQREGCTMFMTLLAAFQVLLYRYTRQTDIVVGSPVAGRNRADVEDLVGFFVNTLVLRTNLSGEPSFLELLNRVKEVALEAYAHQEMPFEKIVEELQPDRDLTRSPIFQVTFALQNPPADVFEVSGVTLSKLQSDTNSAKFDLDFTITERDSTLVGLLEYSTDLFNTSTISQMARHFQVLVSRIVSEPQKPISQLPLLSEGERNWVLAQGNHQKADYPPDQFIHGVFELQAEKTPNVLAVALENEHLRYAELNRRANQLAHHLRALGVGPDVIVGICLERSLQMMVAVLGVLKAGGAYMPLDAAYPRERLNFMLEDTGAAVLLTQENLAASFIDMGVRLLVLDSNWAEVGGWSEDNPQSEVQKENLAYLIYTSGSTGKPKGVMSTHEGLMSALAGWKRGYGLDAGPPHLLQMASFSFDVFTEDWVRALCFGGTLVISPREILLEPRKLYEYMIEHEIDYAEFVPAAIKNLIEHLEETGQSLDFLRVLVVGADRWSMSDYHEARRFCGPATRLINSYGVTESTADNVYFDGTTLDLARGALVPIGRPFANIQIYILDSEFQPVPVGVPGELYIGGASLSRGYIKRPDLTAEKFIPHPYSERPGERLCRTGDLGRYLPDGNIQFLGRMDDQVKVRGYRIELGEIEATLSAHTSVRQSVVIAVPDSRGNSGLIGYVAVEQNCPATGVELRGYLIEKLPAYMVPGAIIPLDSLPLNANGKIDRRALADRSWTERELERRFVAPRDTLELQLTQILEEVLDKRPIGVKDNFFELGGHSLLAVRVVARIEQLLGNSLPLSAFFESPTVEHLATLLRRQSDLRDQSLLVPIQPRGSRSPLFWVHPSGGTVLCYYELAQALDPEQPFYGLQAPGLAEGEAPCPRIEQMAAYYIEAIQAAQAHGPYFLGGWSFGGIVAYEMAQQLQRQGEELGLLAVLDTTAPQPCSAPGAIDNINVLVSLTSAIGNYFGTSLEVSYEEISRLEPDEQLTYVLEKARNADVLPAGAELAQARRYFEVARASEVATRAYVPQPYSGCMTLFRASEQPLECGEDPQLGWHDLVTGTVGVRVVPGDHNSMMRPPNVQILAREIMASLDEAGISEQLGLQDGDEHRAGGFHEDRAAASQHMPR